MQYERKMLELKTKVEELEQEKAESERICGNMEDALKQSRKDYKSVSELLSKEQQSNGRLHCQITELECKLENSENQRMELLNKCDELENQLEESKQEFPFEPMEVAQMLINATFEYETTEIQRRFLNAGDKATCERYNIDQLEQIAEHLLIYCKHNKECEE